MIDFSILEKMHENNYVIAVISGYYIFKGDVFTAAYTRGKAEYEWKMEKE